VLFCLHFVDYLLKSINGYEGKSSPLGRACLPLGFFSSLVGVFSPDSTLVWTAFAVTRLRLLSPGPISSSLRRRELRRGSNLLRASSVNKSGILALAWLSASRACSLLFVFVAIMLRSTFTYKWMFCAREHLEIYPNLLLPCPTHHHPPAAEETSITSLPY
jgi:hypothetical protein